MRTPDAPATPLVLTSLSPPGDTLADLLDEHGLTMDGAAARTGLAPDLLAAIVRADAPITPDVAQRLGDAFHLPAAFWTARDANHCAAVAVLSERVSELEKQGVLSVNDGYRAKREELSNEGLPFARAANINDGFRFDGAELIGWEGVRRAGLKISQPGDVVFTSKGTVGRFALVGEETPRFVYSPQLCYWRSLAPSVLLPRFLYFWMNSPGFISQVGAVKGQTDMAEYVNLRDQRRMRVPLPPLAEQRRIAAVLGALDDKIAANRRMNATLDALARAVFRERFGRYAPGDALPEGWRWGTVSDLIAVDPRTPLRKGETAPYVGMSEIPTSGFQIGEVERKPYAGGARFRRGDTLLARITPCLENGKTTFVDFLDEDEVGFGSTEFIVLRALSGTPAAYPYVIARDEEFRAYVIANMSGSSGRQRASGGDVARYPVVIPTPDALQEYGEVAGPLLRRASANHRTNRTLATLRDTLLPKLISGEVRVAEAEAHAGTAA